MIDKELINKIINERKAINPNNEVAIEIKQQELFDILPDNEDEIIEIVNSCNEEELKYMREIFQDIYAKFTTEKMWEALESLQI